MTKPFNQSTIVREKVTLPIFEYIYLETVSEFPDMVCTEHGEAPAITCDTAEKIDKVSFCCNGFKQECMKEYKKAN